jgi:N-formylglutamate amidohydrolase
MTTLVLHIPHSRTTVPSDVRAALCLTDSELDLELLRMTDHHTEELFLSAAAQLSAESVVFPVSRLVVDPERFEDDSAEPMSRVGMGVIYERTAAGCRLRSRAPTATERQALIDRYYRPHHARLEAAVTSALANGGRCLVVDCHSFPSLPLPYELDQNTDRPDICLGADEFHTPETLIDAARAVFLSEGFTVEVNRPFSGALVPMKYYRAERRVSALMIEVNRRLYMDELTGSRSDRFGAIQLVLRRALDAVA